MNIDAIKRGIVDWNDSRKMIDRATALLTSGVYFEIKREDYEAWKKMDPSFVHVYPTIIENRLQMALIDSTSDQKGLFIDDTLIVKTYENGMNMSDYTGFIETDVSGDITVKTALGRIFKWFLLRNSWIENEILRSSYGLFQAFCLPIKDLDDLFDGPTESKALVVIGLTEDNVAHLILWDEDPARAPISRVEDIVLPVPPFGGEQPEADFQLLLQSLYPPVVGEAAKAQTTKH